MSECAGVAGWEVARYLHKLQGEGVTFRQIADLSKKMWPDDPINPTALARITNAGGDGSPAKNCATVVSLHLADRLCVATGAHLALTFKVICRDNWNAARTFAREELTVSEGWAARAKVEERALELLVESEEHIASGDPRYKAKGSRLSPVMLAV